MIALPVLVLAGGFGTRLKSVVTDLPKPMANVAQKPFLEYQITYLREQGFRQFTLLTGHLAHTIRDYFSDGSALGVKISYCHEDQPRGTGGAIAFAMRQSANERFLVVNGDSLLLTDYVNFVQKSKGPATLALRYETDLRRFGRVECGPDDSVLAFHEKDSTKRSDGLINAGVYVLNRQCLNDFPQERFSMEQDAFTTMAKQGLLNGILAPGPFIDIGLPETLAAAQTLIPSWFTKPAKPCLFLDRDGVLVEHVNYLHRIEDVRIIPAMSEVVRLATNAGWHIVVCSNQSGVGRGMFSEADCQNVNDHIQSEIQRNGGHIHRWHMCFTHPQYGIGPYLRESYSRKPKPGMVLQACDEFRIDLSQSLFLGDNSTDQLEIDGLQTWLIQGCYDLSERKPTTRVFQTPEELLSAFRLNLQK